VAPDGWSAYRSLQGSGFFAAAYDPNPARLGIEAMRSVSTEIIQRWWMSDALTTFDLVELLDQTMARHELLSTDTSDRIYLGLLLLSGGWIEALRPLFRACMEEYLRNRGPLEVELEPIAPELRAVLMSVQPHSPSVWFSRLSSQTGHRAEEKAAIEALQTGFIIHPLRWKLARQNAAPREEF
jgi:hypothetical protein